MSEVADLVKRLREGVVPQSCEYCKKDSMIFVICGRGTCKAERDLMDQAAAALSRMEDRDALVETCRQLERELSAAKRELAEARNVALEDAAKIAGDLSISNKLTRDQQGAMMVCYVQIRALKFPAQGEKINAAGLSKPKEHTAGQPTDTGLPSPAAPSTAPGSEQLETTAGTGSSGAVTDNPVALYNSLTESSPWPDNMNAVVMRKLAAHYEARGMRKMLGIAEQYLDASRAKERKRGAA